MIDSFVQALNNRNLDSVEIYIDERYKNDEREE
jgi:hypothetical protein